MRDFIVYFQFNITSLDFFSSILSLQLIFAYLEEEELEDSMAYVIGECKVLEGVNTCHHLTSIVSGHHYISISVVSKVSVKTKHNKHFEGTWVHETTVRTHDNTASTKKMLDNI